MQKSGFTQAIERIEARPDYDPSDPGYKRLIKRIKTEAKIARKIVEALLAAGYTVGVNDGYETVLRHSTSISDVMAALFSTDEDAIYAHNADGRQRDAIYLVYGNSGYDVICDYSTSLESVMAPVNAYADSLENA